MPLTKKKALEELNASIFECFGSGCSMEEVIGEFQHAAPVAEIEAKEKREQDEWERKHEADA